MRKRNWLLLLPLALVMVLALAACGGSDEENNTPADNNEAAAETTNNDEAAAPATYVTVTVKEAYQQLKDNPDAIIVDVRNPDEWAATGVPKVPQGAKLIPLPEFQQRAPQELPKDQTIYIICNSGNRSRVASDILIKLGYRSVVNIDGGIQAWMREGLETAPYNG